MGFHFYRDNGEGGIAGEDTHGGTPGFVAASVVYDALGGEVKFYPDFMTNYPTITFNFVDVGDQFEVESGAKYVKQERVYAGVNYTATAELYDDGAVAVCYHTAQGSTAVEYTSTLQKFYDFKIQNIATIVPNSCVFMVNNVMVVDRQGKLYADINPITGAGTQVGTINYTAKTVSITTDYAGFVSNTLNVVLKCVSGMTCDVVDSITSVVFRTPGAPITPTQFTIEAVNSLGVRLSATGDANGKVIGTGINGSIRYTTGIVNLDFGERVLDTPAVQDETWYHIDNVSGGYVWKPFFVDTSTIIISCVIESYLPLDAGLLGLDPVRLPLDGRVPIFRDGEILLVHNTKSLVAPNPLTAGQVIDIGRINLSLVELYDSSTEEVWVPDTKYTVDLPTGIITMANPLDLVGFTQPLTIVHRIEDMVLASDVQITGHIAVISPLIHSYEAVDSFVSSVLPIGDLQSRAYNEFEQTSWTSVWSDVLIGSQPLASYDVINFPILVDNRSAVRERFAIIFQSASTVQVVGEHLGVLASGFNIGSGNLSPLNPNTGLPYFTVSSSGWGVGWATGNVFRFNTDAANFPLWFVRTTLQGPATENSDNYTAQIRGDSS